MLKIGYFADGPWSHQAFKRIVSNINMKIMFICVRFDTEDKTLKKYALEHNISYLKHKNINSLEFISRVKAFNCDLFVSMSFNQIFKKEIINLAKYNIINCHAGKLPFYRGRNILNWVLINDEKEFGITVHFVDEGIDTGDIILQKTYPILDVDNYLTLLEKSYIECSNILYDAISLFESGYVRGVSQKMFHPVGFYCNQRKIGDEILNWHQTSREIFNFVRALVSPGPVARAFINNQEMYVNRVELVENAPLYKGCPGSILNKDKNSFYVKTVDSFIKIVDYSFDGSFRVGDRFDVK